MIKWNDKAYDTDEVSQPETRLTIPSLRGFMRAQFSGSLLGLPDAILVSYDASGKEVDRADSGNPVTCVAGGYVRFEDESGEPLFGFPVGDLTPATDED